jgi:hypothetical protein
VTLFKQSRLMDGDTPGEKEAQAARTADQERRVAAFVFETTSRAI